MIALPTMQSLLIEMTYNGTATSTGTGFVYAIGDIDFLITNRHNFTGKDNITGEQLSKNKPTPNQVKIHHHVRDHLFQFIEITEPILSEKEKPLWLEHPTYGAKLDLVALPLTKLENVEIYSMHIYDGIPKLLLSPSEPVSIIGYPFGLRPGGISPVWVTGFIASELDIDYEDLPMFLVDCLATRSISARIFCFPSLMVRSKNGRIFSTIAACGAVTRTSCSTFRPTRRRVRSMLPTRSPLCLAGYSPGFDGVPDFFCRFAVNWRSSSLAPALPTSSAMLTSLTMIEFSHCLLMIHPTTASRPFGLSMRACNRLGIEYDHP